MKLTANGIEIHYTITGEGPVITLSHSLGCNLSMWDDQVMVLSRHYRVLAFDTRGHGQSGSPPGAYSLEQMTEDLHGLLSGLGIQETHFVGLSMGGMIGQVFALTYPTMVKSLALCDTTSRYPGDVWSVWAERIKTVQEKGMEPLVEPTLQRWFTEAFRQRRKDVMDKVRGMLLTTPLQGYIGCCHAIPKINTTERLNAIRCPAVVIVGEEDPGTPVAMAKTMHGALPSSELAILRMAAHLSNMEQPEEFNRVLVRFLDRVTGRNPL